MPRLGPRKQTPPLVGFLLNPSFRLPAKARCFLRVLAIETSERQGTLATLETTGEQSATVGSAVLPADQRSARSLLPAIKTLLDETSWKPSQLDLICVTTGPGSFTGLRIGVTTAKTLAYATGATLVEVHTLAAIAAGVTAPYQRLWTLLDAQRQELFVARFDSGWQTQPTALPETHILPVDKWLQTLRPGDVVSGPPLQKLLERLPEGVLAEDPANWSPRAEVVGQLGIAAYKNGESVNAMQLVPRYYRKSAAEEKIDSAKADSAS